MKRIFKLPIVFAMLVGLFLIPSIAGAQGGPTGSYASGIACLNLSSETASVSITFYDVNGTAKGPVVNDSLAAGSAWLLFTPNIGQLDGNFAGSAVVSSTKAVACSVNTQTHGGAQMSRVGTSDGLGTTQIGPKIYATQVLNNVSGFSSYVAVQNTSGSPVTVNAKFLNSAGAQVGTASKSIPAYSSHVFNQNDGTLPAGYFGSAIFEAANNTTALAGSAAIFNSGATPEQAQFLSYNTFKEGANKVFVPRLAKNLSGLGYTSGWSCQNLGPGNADISMAVTMLNQATNTSVSATLSKTGVAEGQAWAGYMGSTGNATLDGIERGFGSAVVTSTGGKVACTVNEDVRTSPTANLVGQGTTYSAVPDGNQSNKMFFPQIVALGGNSFRGGFQIANTTGTATTCTYTFTNSIGSKQTFTVENQPLAANGSNSVFAESVLPGDKTSFNGSATVQCGQPIVGIYNLSIQGPNASGDPFAQNNGINQ
jgi:hypothetical protein